MQNQVSVIIPMYNVSGCIDDCLSSVLNQTAAGTEVLLIDDRSTDDTVRKAARYPFKIIKLERHLNPAAVRNYGARQATGDVLIFADADVVLQPGSLEKAALLASGPDADAVYGIYTKDTVQTSFFSQLQNLVIVYRCEKLPRDIDMTLSFFCAIKRRAFEDVGGYDENMPYYEDVELGKKLVENGYRCRFEPEIKTMHLKYYDHKGLIADYLKKSAAVALYIKRNGFGNKVTDNGWPLSVKIAGASAVCLLASIFLIKITVVPFLIFFGLHCAAMGPLLSYLVKAKGPGFGMKSYPVLFEIFLAIFAGLFYGFLKRGKND